jgi:hypothetical protein
MNFEYWKGELTLYPEECVSSEEEEYCMIANTMASPVTIVVDPQYDIKIETIEGREYITLHKKTKANIKGDN